MKQTIGGKQPQAAKSVSKQTPRVSSPDSVSKKDTGNKMKK